MSAISYTARWVLSAAGPPLPNGVLVVRDDKIEAVLPCGERTPDVDLGHVALIPGLVNAHTHLDLSGARGKIPPTDPDHFTDWLKGVIAYRKTRTAEEVQRDIREGLAECLKAGTTLVGDIASGGLSWDIIENSKKLRGFVFREFIGLTTERKRQAWFDMLRWQTERTPTELCRPGSSPHSPYSCHWSLIQAASREQLPIAIHWLETRDEQDLIEHGTGPFTAFLKDMNAWEEGSLINSHSYIHLHAGCHNRTLFIHANYQPASVLWRPNSTVVYCPRTHAAFGHPPHPFREFMKRGVRVCLGTDSLASNPDLDILAEARFVKQRYPDFDGETLLKMVTLFGAEALGWADECGSLEPGKSADAVAVPLPDREGDPYDLLFGEDTGGERKTMFRGEWRI